MESGLLLSSVSVVDLNGDGQIDLAQPVGSNGLADVIETAPGSGLPDYDDDGSGPDAVADTDGDGVPDFRDLDSEKAVQIYAYSRLEAGRTLISLGRTGEGLEELRISARLSPAMRGEAERILREQGAR